MEEELCGLWAPPWGPVYKSRGPVVLIRKGHASFTADQGLFDISNSLVIRSAVSHLAGASSGSRYAALDTVDSQNGNDRKITFALARMMSLLQALLPTS